VAGVNDPTFIPESDRQLLAIYDDAHTAARARTAVLDAGVPPDAVHLDEKVDVISGLRAEMAEEITRGGIQPQAGALYPKESVRGFAMVGGIGIAIGIALAFPLAAIDWGSSYGVRLLVFVVVFSAFGATIGMVAGASLAAPRPGAEAAAIRGTTLRVEQDDARLRDLLVGFRPIRLDELSMDGGPVDTVVTEGRDDLVETAKDIVANADSDDYSLQRESAEVRRSATSPQRRGGLIEP
jgi:hypothetical protein